MMLPQTPKPFLWFLYELLRGSLGVMRSNRSMSYFIQMLFGLLLRFVTALFGIGILGCTVVLIMTFWEDLRTIIRVE
jgi:hypothetical protein